MKRVFRHSLPTRAWAAIIMISLLSLMTAISSAFIAWVAEADAEAINIAGSIRMATYRISYQLSTDFKDIDPLVGQLALPEQMMVNDNNSQADVATEALIKDMEVRLLRLREYQQGSSNQSANINQQLSNIEKQWLTQLKPELYAQDKHGFYMASIDYIHDVDELVNELQYRNERRQNWQQLLQISSLLISVLIMLAGMHELRQNVLTPVRNLIKANRKFKKGELGTRVHISGYNEFVDLGTSFNDMAKTIESYQRSLEQQVLIKTQHLLKANQVLTLLYDFAKQLTSAPVTLSKLDSLIETFAEIMPQLEVTLCIRNQQQSNKDSISLHGKRLKEHCASQACDSCDIQNSLYTRNYPIVNQGEIVGELKIRPRSQLGLDEQMTYCQLVRPRHDEQSIKMYDEEPSFITDCDDLIIALTNLISTSLSLRKQRQQEYQLVLLEERTTIARELHDSLAQSLSYLKIQVSMLEKHLQQHAETIGDSSKIWQSIEQIKTGLSSAYHELRELLVTFRLSIENDSFDDALAQAADEFSLKGNFDITLNNRVMSLNLSASEQVNLLQIAREALSNISRHAQAQSVNIDIIYQKDINLVCMSIVDDGIGIRSEVDQRQHHGLLIMQERANYLGGELKITNKMPHGTIVTVQFAPEFFLSQDASDTSVS